VKQGARRINLVEVVIVDPLVIVVTADGPHLQTGDWLIVAPEEFASAAAKEQALDRWARSRRYARLSGTCAYRPQT
jgi:hypothetical protein